MFAQRTVLPRRLGTDGLSSWIVWVSRTRCALGGRKRTLNLGLEGCGVVIGESVTV